MYALSFCAVVRPRPNKKEIITLEHYSSEVEALEDAKDLVEDLIADGYPEASYEIRKLVDEEGAEQ